MENDTQVLKRKWDDLCRAREEESDRPMTKPERKRKKMALRESFFGVLNAVYSGERFQFVRDAGIKLAFSAKAGPWWMSEITFIWSNDSATLCIKYFFDDEEANADSSLSIEVITDAETFCLDYLSARNAEKWREVAQAFGMPECLLDSARITEFCVALMAPLVTQNELKRYVYSLDRVERDGTMFYAGHGGHMPVVFKPKFRKEHGFYLGASC